VANGDFCNERCDAVRRTGMRTRPEVEDASVGAGDVEAIGIWIQRRIAARGRKHHQNRIASVHGLTGDRATARDKPTRALRRWIE
jgi:hypothetical protein